MYGLAQQVLRTDVSGMPLEWVDYRDAVRLYKDRIESRRDPSEPERA